MKKMIVSILMVTCLLSFTGCLANGKDDSKGQLESNNTTASTETNNTTITPTTADSSTTEDNDDALKAELLEKYGGKFEFYLAFDMQLINFNFDETTVVRQHFDSLKDEQPTHNGTWDIVNGELVVSGEWNESFILNLEFNTATSKSDGCVYPIYQVD